MTKLMKKLAAVFLAVILAFALMPVIGSLTGGKAGLLEAGAAYVYNNHVSADGEWNSQAFAQMGLDGETGLYLMGDSTITLAAGDNLTVAYIIIPGNCRLTILGDDSGILHILHGVEIIQGGTLEVQGGTVDISGGYEYGDATSGGIYSVNNQGHFELSGGEVGIYNNSPSTRAVYGIYASSVNISGGELMALASSEQAAAEGIHTSNFNAPSSISGGAVVAAGFTSGSGQTAAGITCSGDARYPWSITGGAVQAVGESANGEGYGMMFWDTVNKLVISDAEIIAEGTMHGLKSSAPMTITGSAEVEATSGSGYGLAGDAGITLSGNAYVDAEAHGTNGRDVAVRSGSSGTRELLITDNAELKADANVYAVWSDGKVTIDKKAKVTATANARGDQSKFGFCGIFSNEQILIQGDAEVDVTAWQRGIGSDTVDIKGNADVKVIAESPASGEAVYGINSVQVGGNAYLQAYQNGTVNQACAIGAGQSISFSGRATIHAVAAGERAVTAPGGTVQVANSLEIRKPAGGKVNGSVIWDPAMNVPARDVLIVPKPNVEDAEITLDKTEYTYDGTAKMPDVTVKYDGAPLEEGIDFKVAYTNNTNAGNAMAKVTGIGTYGGTVDKSFKIKPADLGSLGAQITVEDKVYTGSEIRPAAVVKIGSKTLKAGTDYVLSYDRNKDVGVAEAAAAGKGNYSGSVDTGFRILFTDVADPGKYYFDPVYWALDKGVTSGSSASTFGPSNPCTRAQIVTFLWHAAGDPAPASTRNPFSDVKAGSYYYNAVLWAVEKGITTGTSSTTFSPGNPCTRAQSMTFLYNAKEKPADYASINFTDVKSSAYYYNAVRWAVKNGITSGVSATEFGSGRTCTRAQIVTFLYKAYS